MTPAGHERAVAQTHRASCAYDAVSIGYPGVVFRGRIAAEPHNLGRAGWDSISPRHLGRPVRIVNDAAMQALGSYRGGRMLFLGLGTGLGVTLIIDGVVEPTELGHMPYKHGRTYEDYVGERGRKRRGNKKWRKSVQRDRRAAAGGARGRLRGARRRQRRAPQAPAAGARLGDNRNAFAGGLRLWQQQRGVHAC